MDKNKIKVYGLFIVILFTIGLGVLFFELTSGYAFKNDEVVYQVLSGEKHYYDEQTKFIYKENGTSYIGATKSEYLSDSPLYFQSNDHEIVLSSDQIYVNGNSAQFKKVSAFANMSTENGLKYKDTSLLGGFIFNGRNCYTFLEDMTLEINGKSYQVHPFSFVEVNDSTYVIYDLKNDFVEAGRLYLEDAYAYGENYTVDLSNDIFKDSTGKEVLIYVNTMSLDELK